MKSVAVRVFALLAFGMVTLNAFAQQTDECGFENRRLLSTQESNFLNLYFAKDSFDFTCKKIAFFTGNAGNVIGSKEGFFKNAKQTDSTPVGGLLPFTYFQKLSSGGYDGIVTYWAKIAWQAPKYATLLQKNEERKRKQGLICSVPIEENKQPDTVTTLLFSNGRNLPVTKLPGADPKSNYGFTTKAFSVSWLPIYKPDIEYFAASSLGSTRNQVIDTTSVSIFGEKNEVIISKTPKGYLLILYQKQKSRQDFITAGVRRKTDIPTLLNYINKYMQ